MDHTERVTNLPFRESRGRDDEMQSRAAIETLESNDRLDDTEESDMEEIWGFSPKEGLAYKVYGSAGTVDRISQLVLQLLPNAMPEQVEETYKVLSVVELAKHTSDGAECKSSLDRLRTAYNVLTAPSSDFPTGEFNNAKIEWYRCRISDLLETPFTIDDIQDWTCGICYGSLRTCDCFLRPCFNNNTDVRKDLPPTSLPHNITGYFFTTTGEVKRSLSGIPRKRNAGFSCAIVDGKHYFVDLLAKPFEERKFFKNAPSLEQRAADPDGIEDGWERVVNKYGRVQYLHPPSGLRLHQTPANNPYINGVFEPWRGDFTASGDPHSEALAQAKNVGNAGMYWGSLLEPNAACQLARGFCGFQRQDENIAYDRFAPIWVSLNNELPFDRKSRIEQPLAMLAPHGVGCPEAIHDGNPMTAFVTTVKTPSGEP
jgi:hypothetical protein